MLSDDAVRASGEAAKHLNCGQLVRQAHSDLNICLRRETLYRVWIVTKPCQMETWEQPLYEINHGTCLG